MANFFGKAKPAAMGSPSKGRASAKDGENGSPGPTTIQSDFQRTFRPFALKKDAEIAPENWFRDNRRLAKKRGANSTEGNVIIIDDEDDDEPEEAEPDVEMIDPQELNASPAGKYFSLFVLQTVLHLLRSTAGQHTTSSFPRTESTSSAAAAHWLQDLQPDRSPWAHVSVDGSRSCRR